MTERLSVDAVIIGAGFAGICMAVELQKAGISDFLILEKALSEGGTWRDNVYPGAACDVPSALYSYSFEQNSAWAYKWSRQDQILAYQRGIVDRYGLRPKIRFDAKLQAATWDEAAKQWMLVQEDGQTLSCRWFIPAVGQLHHPKWPEIQGLGDFQGPVMHSARWDLTFDPTGKRIAVIGNAASAVQLVPELVKAAKTVTVFQRSANWILPKLDRPYMPWEQALSAKFPVLARAYRYRLWLMSELFLYQVIRGKGWAKWLAKRLAVMWREHALDDPKLRALQTPDYPIGAKRILFTDDWYKALAADHCHLVTDRIAGIKAKGIETEQGVFLAADAIVCATGFHTHPFLKDIQVTGQDGLDLQDHWRDGAHAWMGMMTRHFPNLMMLYGPSTNLGHTSVLLMIEEQAAWIARTLKAVGDRGRLEVKDSAEKAFLTEMQTRLPKMAWASIADSWYLQNGVNINNWPGSTSEYQRRCRQAGTDMLDIGD